MKPKISVSQKILAIRAKAGNDNTICPVCGHKPASPFRAYSVGGKIINGCVDAIHTGHLVGISESNRWQHRPAAVVIRRMELSANQWPEVAKVSFPPFSPQTALAPPRPARFLLSPFTMDASQRSTRGAYKDELQLSPQHTAPSPPSFPARWAPLDLPGTTE